MASWKIFEISSNSWRFQLVAAPTCLRPFSARILKGLWTLINNCCLQRSQDFVWENRTASLLILCYSDIHFLFNEFGINPLNNLLKSKFSKNWLDQSCLFSSHNLSVITKMLYKAPVFRYLPPPYTVFIESYIFRCD